MGHAILVELRGIAPTYPVMVMRACCCAMIGPFCRIGNKGAAESTDEGAKATRSRRNGLRERGSARLSASLRFRGRTTIPDSTILVQAQPANVDKGRRFGRVVDSRWINLTYPPQCTADICMVFVCFPINVSSHQASSYLFPDKKTEDYGISIIFRLYGEIIRKNTIITSAARRHDRQSPGLRRRQARLRRSRHCGHALQWCHC